MTNIATINKLIEMRLTAMATAFRTQLQDSSLQGFSFEERLGMLVDIEYTNRKNNRLHRLIKNASFDQPGACIAEINYRSGRKLNKNLIERLSSCEYITEKHNLIVLGATGAGKSYIACAFGMEACKRHYTVRYIRLPELLAELAVARGEGSFKKSINRGQGSTGNHSLPPQKWIHHFLFPVCPGRLAQENLRNPSGRCHPRSHCP